MQASHHSTSKRKPEEKFFTKQNVIFLSGMLVITVTAIIAILLFSRGKLLHTIEKGDFRFELYGKTSLERIEIYQKDKKLGSIKAASSLDASEDYGLRIEDLNADGYPDLLVSRETHSDNKLYHCWLWDATQKAYTPSELLSGAYNLTLDAESGYLYAHYEERRNIRTDGKKTHYEDAELLRIFRVLDGKMVEYTRYEFVYYSESDVHLYAVTRFDPETGKLATFSEDNWITSPVKADAFSLLDTARTDFEAYEAEKNNEANDTEESTGETTDIS